MREFDRLTSEETVEVLKKHPVALLPLGAVENHGDHLPLGTDNDLAQGVAHLVAEKLDDAVIIPLLPYGQVWSLRDYPGSINISNETLSRLIVEIGESLHRQGVPILAVINGHMGNLDAMKSAARELYEIGMTVLYLTYPGTSEIIKKVRESEGVHSTYFHACELETSYMLYLSPKHVKMDKAIRQVPEFTALSGVTPTPWSKLMKSAVLGDATIATREKGEAIISVAVENIVNLINEVRREINEHSNHEKN